MLVMCDANVIAQIYQIHGAPYIKNYRTDEMNGAGPQVWHWITDNRGMVYIGDSNSIYEFDGREWTQIRNNNSSPVRSMAIDSLGIIYVGALGDFGYLQPNSQGEMKFVSLAKPIIDRGIKFLDIWRVYNSTQGIFYCSDKYIFKYFNKKVTVIPVDLSVLNTYLLNNLLYVLSTEGLYSLNDTGFVKISPKINYDFIPWKDDQFLTVSRDDKIQIFHLDTGEFTDFEGFDQNFFKANTIHTMARIDEGHFAVATETNIILILSANGELIRYIDKEDGLNIGHIYRLFVDNSKNLWVCASKGISKIDINFPFFKFDEKNNISNNVLTSIFYKGKWYIGTVDGLYYLSKFEISKPESSRKFSKINTKSAEYWQFEIIDNKLYVISSKGLWLINDTKAELIYNINDSEIAQCFATNPLFPNTVFIGMRGKFLAIELHGSKAIENIKVVNEMVFPEIAEVIVHIAADKEGNLWLNTKGEGVYFVRFIDNDIHNYRITLLDEKNGLSYLGGIRNYIVDSHIVVSTNLGILEPIFPSKPNAPDSLIYFKHSRIFGDTITILYPIVTQISDDNYLIAREKMQYVFADGTKQPYNIPAFNRITSSIRRISFNSDSIISLSSPDGLINYDMKNHRDFDDSFSTVIRKVEIGNDSILFGGCFYTPLDSVKIPVLNQPDEFIPSIAYQYNSLTFHFAALFYENPELTEFQYQLHGFDEKWSNWSTENKAVYTNLSNGKYTFKVRAKNVYSVMSDVAQYKFSITAPWYKAWWAYPFYVILFAGIIYFIIKVYTHRLQKQKEYLELVVEERTGEIIEQARELKAINEKLLEMDKFKQGVTSMIVHDLKNPINAIINVSKSNPEVQLERIKQTGRQMLNLVLNILDVSKYEETKIMLCIENHSLLSISQRAIEQILFLSKEKNININNQIEANLGIRADAEMVERVFVNILTNAIKYTPNNGKITLSALNYKQKENEYLKITISDNGVGIPNDKIHLVFQKFGQVIAKNSGLVRSTGLGLAYCKIVIEAHGGEIGVESESGKGSAFWFTLPQSEIVVAHALSSFNIKEVLISKLSEASRKAIEVHLDKLQKTEFYKITEINAILDKIDETTSEEIKTWKRAMINAVDSGNELLYKKLL